jgi:hypothetical protein
VRVFPALLRPDDTNQETTVSKDRYERRHRRTARNYASVETMASANFDAVPSLAEAMGLGEASDEDLAYAEAEAAVAAAEAALVATFANDPDLAPDTDDRVKAQREAPDDLPF